MRKGLFLIFCFALVGCGRPTPEAHRTMALEQWLDSEVTVYFRRDLLGAAGTPIAPTSTWLNNTKVSLTGKINSVHEAGIFLDSHYKVNSGDTDSRHSIFWVPKDSILTIEKNQ